MKQAPFPKVKSIKVEFFGVSYAVGGFLRAPNSLTPANKDLIAAGFISQVVPPISKGDYYEG
jgi:hypothetical protein